MNANFMQLDRLPHAGESLRATGVFQEHGGKGLNLGVGMHRLGLKVRLLLGIGADQAGRAVHDFLTSENIDTTGIYYLPASSGYGVGFIGENGENFLAAYHGANALINAHHVAEQCHDMPELNWVCAQFEAPDAAILHAFEIAKQRGAMTYLNPSPWRIPSAQMLALTDVLVVNATEAALMLDLPEAANWDVNTWLARLPALPHPYTYLVITLAELGAISISATGELCYQPAYRIQQIDATGAGDAFGCGLVYALSQQLSMPQALQIANACGAQVAATQGILDTLPNVEQIAEFMHKYQAEHIR
jgi:ribokinase